MRYKCQNCSAVNVVAENLGGTESACGRCNQPFVVPDSDMAIGVVYGGFAIDGVLVERSHETDYKATQLSLKRELVLKIVSPELSANEAFAKSFLDASRKASQLSHPFLCQSIGAGKENGKYFLAREKGGEQSLRSMLIQDGSMDWQRAARLACDLAQGLDYAWSVAKLGHFNVKPDYVMVSADDHARLADVGLAGLNPDPDADRIIGTPQYISPERIVGMDGDTRSDLYSLGVTLFYMVTAHFPFDAQSSSEFIDHHLNSEPKRASLFVPSLPAAFCDVLAVLMAKNPNMRYQNGAQLVKDLKAVLAGTPPAFVAQALELKASKETVSEPKVAIAKEVDATQEQKHVSPEVRFDDLDNFFDDLEAEFENETQTLTHEFSMPTDEFDALLEEIDEEPAPVATAVPDVAPPAPPVPSAAPVPPAPPQPKVAMPVAAADPLLNSHTQSNMPVSVTPAIETFDFHDDDDDDDVPMVKPLAKAGPSSTSFPVPQVAHEDDELAEEVDELFSEPAAAAQSHTRTPTSFPAMGATANQPQAGQPAPNPKKKRPTNAGGKKKKFKTRAGTRGNLKIRKK